MRSSSNCPEPTGLIEQAIKVGSPMFSPGVVAACAAIGGVASRALLSIIQVTAESRAEPARSLKTARAESSPKNQLWIQRAGLDSACKHL